MRSLYIVKYKGETTAVSRYELTPVDGPKGDHAVVAPIKVEVKKGSVDADLLRFAVENNRPVAIEITAS